jgi:hypothetical protein
MKKLVRLLALFGIATLVILLAVGSVGAQEDEADQPDPEGTATRINFEQSEDSALEGLYVVQETGGRIVATWYAEEGWRDSGWLNHLDLAHESVWVNVLFYPGPDTEPTTLTILNHAPKKTYGWLSRGTAHALEVAWPEAEEM